MLGLPTAAIAATGVGGDVGKYANQFTQAIGAPVRKAETAAGQGAANAYTGGGSNTSASNTATSVGEQAAINTVGLGIPQAVNTIAKVFCFHPDTQIEMANGGVKSICKIQIGEETKGGIVYATLRGMATEFYWYGGVLVTGKHAVKESGGWVRVEDSAIARRFKYLTEVVCNLVTEKHRIWANGIEFADFYETDQYESLDMKESLEEMNRIESLR
jgi:hypothetical protein